MPPPYQTLEAMEAATGTLVSGLNTATLSASLASMGCGRSGFGDFIRLVPYPEQQRDGSADDEVPYPAPENDRIQPA